MKFTSQPSPCVGIRTCSDYSPFGVELDGRTVSSGYRFGFQNQELDDEIKGEGNSVNYTFRMHDPRLGRFFAVDPFFRDFPWNSTYAFCENRLLDCKELEGLQAVSATHKNYFNTAGIYIFMKNSEKGFSAKGQIFLLGQSATESGYGVESNLKSSVDKNNYWGLKKGKVKLNYSTIGEGYQAWESTMNNNFPEVLDVLMKKNFTINELQNKLNPGEGKLNYDPGNEDYAQNAYNNGVNALKRMILVIDEDITLKEKRQEGLVKDYKNNNPTFANSKDRASYVKLDKEINYLKKAKIKAENVLKEAGEN